MQKILHEKSCIMRIEITWKIMYYNIIKNRKTNYGRTKTWSLVETAAWRSAGTAPPAPMRQGIKRKDGWLYEDDGTWRSERIHVTPVFKERKGIEYKVVTVYAKKARGQMVRYITKNRITKSEDIKNFDLDGYEFNERLSEGDTWVFTRD